MRRTTAGLLSLALASGLGVTFSSQAAFAAPPADTGQGAAAAKSSGPDELPNPAEEKRRALRSEAITQILNGEVAPQQVNGSTVVKLKGAKDSTPAPARPGQKAAQDVQTKDKYVELKREKTDKIFVILAEFGNERHPSYPDTGHQRGDTWSGPVRRPPPQRDRRAEPGGRQLDRLAGRLQRGPLPPALLRQGQRRRVAEDVLRGSVLGSLQRQR